MISIILLVAFIKLSLHYNNPLVLAGIYTAMTTLFTAMMGVEISMVIVSAIITMALMWLFFWLLDRYEETSTWWVIVIVFPVLMFVLSRVQ